MSCISAPPSSPIGFSSSPIFVPVLLKNDTSYCTKCKRLITAAQQFKRCLLCREKLRDYKKKVATSRVALAPLEVPNDNGVVTNGKRKEREDDDVSRRLKKMRKKMREHFQEYPTGALENALNTISVSTRSIDD
jgi:hypothetical protein